jgi:hypothetical protein
MSEFLSARYPEFQIPTKEWVAYLKPIFLSWY